ncbi:lipoprotein [Massilia varians]|uniref:Lipoprotein n=1 Tax=Massilia varians TaxID=457921 RepID=A0ABM8C8N0_9BURK|nr:lipid-binding SYLF domain-containing protein [Massilia varians]BDT59581.1 lipoprotein [Massilia varians]
MLTDIARGAVAAAVFVLLSAPAAVAAQESRAGQGTPNAAQPAETGAQRKETAARRVADAAGVARTMAATPAIAALLGRARGVYIVPTYGRAALGLGAEGGSGVLMTRHADGRWGNPVFYTIGGISLGLQAGAEGGPFALLLMNQKAVDHFRKRNNFSLNADAGLTVINYARMAQGTTAGDVVVWSGSKGLFGNAATIAIDGIRYNQRLTHAYYGKPITALEAMDGGTPEPQSEPLRTALGK